MDGYYAGLNACSGGGGGGDDGGFEDGQAPPSQTEERHYEGYNWRSICRSVDNLLSEPCESLVTPGGRALTNEGKSVLEKLLCLAGEPIIGLVQPQLLPIVGILCLGKG